MDFLKLQFLAIIQGLTEFLPVSSSGHLALFKNLFGLEEPGAAGPVLNQSQIDKLIEDIRAGIVG